MSDSWLGYIYSNDSSVNFVPQKVQNLVIRDYLSKVNKDYKLSFTEFNFDDLYITLKTILSDKINSRIAFYSFDLFPTKEDDLFTSIRGEISSGNLEIIFALEEVHISCVEDFDTFFKTREMSNFLTRTDFSTSNTRVRFRDLRVHDRGLRKKYINSINSIFDHGMIVEGSELEEFEKNLSAKIGTEFSLGLSSGTDSIYLALKALGIKKGDQVLIPNMSWIATAHAVSMCEATPVFVDIKNDLTICEYSLERLITSCSKAIIAVHFMGHICNMKKISSIAKKHNLKVIEDCAQSFGSEIDGIMAGNFSDISCFSFNPMKGLNAFGEAGAICTNNKEFYESIRTMRYCGYVDGQVQGVSLNYRLDTIQASFLNINLSDLARKQSKMNLISNYYIQNLSNDFEIVQGSNNNPGSNYGFVLFLDNRNLYIDKLSHLGIETRVQHVPLMSEYSFYKDCPSEHENADIIKNKILNLPFHEKLDYEQLDYIVTSLLSIRESLDG